MVLSRIRLLTIAALGAVVAAVAALAPFAPIFGPPDPAPVFFSVKAAAAVFGLGFLAVILMTASRRAFASSVALAIFLFAAPAFASETSVDFKPMVDLAISFAVAVLTALAPIAAAYIALKANKSLGLKIDAQQRAVIEQGLARAIGFGVEQARKRLPAGPVVDLKSAALAQAVTYAQSAIPGALGHFGITPEKLADMIEARFAVSEEPVESAA